ncbi:MAG: methylenetetrahydrofolate reductase [Firmicutes bacterium]|nr:methylenetetrahydrofolate reductase [Alicyclobacillaceae bacterium]MCL6497188.1 methylenetetrahydrofolate reductase [Bacillota bacterium]
MTNEAQSRHAAFQAMRYEVIPMKGIDEQVQCLPKGAVVTVTCSPRHGIDKSIELADRYRQLGYHAIPHMAARLVRDRRHLAQLVERLTALGLEEVFVIAGDEARPEGEFEGALGVLEAMADLPQRPQRIGIGSYPDGHPLLKPEQLTASLKAKQPYASYMVTQLCFDAEKIATWLADMRDQGITLPVYVGIPGLVERRKLFEIALRIGVGDSARFIRKHTNMAQELMAHDRYDPWELIMAILEAVDRRGLEVAGFHVNTFNQVCATVDWRQECLDRLAVGAGDADPASRGR